MNNLDEEQLKTYGDIVKRIMTIIKTSEQKKKELDPLELRHNYNNYFTYILYYDIEISLANEFRELIDTERTFNNIERISPLTYLDKTRTLLELCKASADMNNANYTYYDEIIHIINESYGKSALALTEYNGYFILREKFKKWLWLMRKLNLFPNTSKNDLNNYLFQNHEQYARLQTLFTKLENKPFEKNEDRSFSINLGNNKHSDIVFLGISGNLKLEYLRELKLIYSNAEFQSLLDELAEWQIFNEEELNKLRIAEPKSSVVLEGNDCFDKLIRFFFNNGKITDANALRYLKPVIGEENLKNLVDALHNLGTISEDVYEKYIQLDSGKPARSK